MRVSWHADKHSLQAMLGACSLGLPTCSLRACVRNSRHCHLTAQAWSHISFPSFLLVADGWEPGQARCGGVYRGAPAERPRAAAAAAQR